MFGIADKPIVVPSGTELTYYRTDSSTYADFILSDGQIGRAALEWIDGFCYIDGTYIYELFDGIIFAG